MKNSCSVTLIIHNVLQFFHSRPFSEEGGEQMGKHALLRTQREISRCIPPCRCYTLRWRRTHFACLPPLMTRGAPCVQHTPLHHKFEKSRHIVQPDEQIPRPRYTPSKCWETTVWRSYGIELTPLQLETRVLQLSYTIGRGVGAVRHEGGMPRRRKLPSLSTTRPTLLLS